jgi:ABC-type Fe3+ transport system substrate-binding protein
MDCRGACFSGGLNMAHAQTSAAAPAGEAPLRVYAAGSPQPSAGRGTYAWLMDEGRADIFLTYCTNAMSARKEVPRLAVVAIPPALEVGAAYALTFRKGDAAAAQFAQYLLSPQAQAVFGAFGFGAP